MAVTVSVEGNSPTVLIIATSSTGIRQRFTISVLEIEELDHNDLVDSLDLSTVIFQTSYVKEPYFQSWTFTATLIDGRQVGMYPSYLFVRNFVIFRMILIHEDHLHTQPGPKVEPCKQPK